MNTQTTISHHHYYCGIDPGVSGGVCCITPNGRIALFKATPSDNPYKWRMLMDRVEIRLAESVMMEKTSGFIGTARPGSRMYQFGRNAGRWEGLFLATKGTLPELVDPKTWQSALGIDKRKKSENRQQFKNRLKSFAQTLFPDIVVCLATADAILIAEYCRRLKEGWTK